MQIRGWVVLGTFLYVWLMVGFATGTATLIGPVQWVTGGVRGSALGPYEDYLMWAVIGLFVAGSFLLARWLVRHMFRSESRPLRWGIPTTATGLAALALWGWMHPAVYANVAGGAPVQQVAVAGGAEFLFGPYPDAARLRELKAEGVTAVVSLQHPAVVPFEPEGIQAERRVAREIGLPFIHAPMLPWVSDNEQSLDKILRLARSGTGKYYVHCGLGRDRVNVVRRMLEREGARVAEGSGLVEATTFADREEPFERGAVRPLADGVWLIPHPNEHEWFGYVLAGQVERVVLLLDPEREPEWVAEAQRLLTRYGVAYELTPLRPGDIRRAAEIAALVRAGPQPVAVVAPVTAPEPGDEVARTFARAFTAVATGATRTGAPAASAEG